MKRILLAVMLVLIGTIGLWADTETVTETVTETATETVTETVTPTITETFTPLPTNTPAFAISGSVNPSSYVFGETLTWSFYFTVTGTANNVTMTAFTIPSYSFVSAVPTETGFSPPGSPYFYLPSMTDTTQAVTVLFVMDIAGPYDCDTGVPYVFVQPAIQADGATPLMGNQIQAPRATCTFTFTPTATFTPTMTPTKVVAIFYSSQNIFNTEKKGSYTGVSVVATTHNWNTLNYTIFADAIGNSYTIIRRTKNLNDVVFEVLDLEGNTINGDFDYLLKR